MAAVPLKNDSKLSFAKVRLRVLTPIWQGSQCLHLSQVPILTILLTLFNESRLLLLVGKKIMSLLLGRSRQQTTHQSKQ
jgi:hypothetical protein